MVVSIGEEAGNKSAKEIGKIQNNFSKTIDKLEKSSYDSCIEINQTTEKGKKRWNFGLVSH